MSLHLSPSQKVERKYEGGKEEKRVSTQMCVGMFALRVYLFLTTVTLGRGKETVLL